jgi:hypothetical protein
VFLPHRLAPNCIKTPANLCFKSISASTSNFKGTTTTKLASSEFWGTNSVAFSTKVWEIFG